jgi:hypothetical protein
MDTDMTDVSYDIDIDVAGVPQPQQIIEVSEHPRNAICARLTNAQQNTTESSTKDEVPAAYLEDLSDLNNIGTNSTQPKAWPEQLNLQGVGEFDPNDPLYFAMEHLGPDIRVKQLRWVNDDSVNLEFYSPEDAAEALKQLTDPLVDNADKLAPQESRLARRHLKKPDIVLRIRETNERDQKGKGAANRSGYYQRNPDVASNRQREPRRRQPQRDFLDYGEDDRGVGDRRRRRLASSVKLYDSGLTCSSSGDESMGEDSGVERRRNNYRNDRDTRGRGRNDRGGRPRDDRGGGRMRDDRDSGRLNADVDSYRPNTTRYFPPPHPPTPLSNKPRSSPRESRAGRLRGRSASPASNEEGDGRYGFAEDTSNLRTRYRSRSRSRAPRRRNPSPDRWTHDKYGTSALDSSPMGNHRRSDAFDASTKSGSSLLARMTKDGVPLLPQKRSLADRITRVDVGRLRDDDSEIQFMDFSEKPKKSLMERMTRDTEFSVKGKGREREGMNIRGSAKAGDSGAGGINIRGVASGA